MHEFWSRNRIGFALILAIVFATITIALAIRTGYERREVRRFTQAVPRLRAGMQISEIASILPETMGNPGIGYTAAGNHLLVDPFSTTSRGYCVCLEIDDDRRFVVIALRVYELTDQLPVHWSTDEKSLRLRELGRRAYDGEAVPELKLIHADPPLARREE